MSNDLSGKRLLVLGSTALIANIVKKAQKMGVFVIVTDNKDISVAPAKRIADKYYNISLADVEEIVALIRDEHIDGVITGFTDSYIPYYEKICQKANLPCYGDHEAFCIATDKALFKSVCNESGVCTIPGKCVTNKNELFELVEDIGYPLILKPADNSGSRGVIYCASEENLEHSFDYAMSFSSGKKVICERFMDCDCFGVSYQLKNGEVYLSSTCDKYNYFSEDGISNITADLLYPSKYTQRYINEVDSAVKNMLKKHGFHDGMVSLQAFVDDNNFYMCEMCYRPSGGHHYLLINHVNNVDGLAMLIEYSLCGSVAGYSPENENVFFSKRCGMLHLIGKPFSKISLINGFNKAERINGVIAVNQNVSTGTVTGKDGTTAQVVGSVWYCFENDDDLTRILEEINRTIVVKDENGENIIKPHNILN